MPTKTKTKTKKRSDPVTDVLRKVKPLVTPVLSQLERHAQMLEEIKSALEIQFKRTAAIQAQLDKLLATLAETRDTKS